MTGITDDGIEIDRDIAAPPEAVFAAWTTPESFAQWFGGREVQVPRDSLDYHAEAGREWSATMVIPDGNRLVWADEFRELDAPSRVVMTFTDQPSEGTRAVLAVEITPTPTGAHLRMTQETPGFSDE